MDNPTLKSKVKVTQALRSLVAGRDVVSIHCDEHFFLATMVHVDQEHFYFRIGDNDKIAGPCAFSTRDYQFSSPGAEATPMANVYRAQLPHRIDLIQRRKFLRRKRRSDADCLIRLAIGDREVALRILNISLSGIETDRPAENDPTIDGVFRNAHIDLEDMQIRMDVAVIELTGHSIRFEIADLSIKDFQSLQRLLSSREAWEPSDFSMVV